MKIASDDERIHVQSSESGVAVSVNGVELTIEDEAQLQELTQVLQHARVMLRSEQRQSRHDEAA